MEEAHNHLFCFGLGYSAQALANKLLQKNWRISGTKRTQEGCEQLQSLGITAHLYDDNEMPLLHPEEALQHTTHMLISSPPSSDAQNDIIDYHGGIIKDLSFLKWIGLLSTTSVYGDHEGGWVDETTRVGDAPYADKNRVYQENRWKVFAEENNVPLHIFRLGGIYGPERNYCDAIQNGNAYRIDATDHCFSRIHVKDIVHCLYASMQSPSKNSMTTIYNVVDDLPSMQSDVVAYTAQLLHKELPPLYTLEDAPLSEKGRSFFLQKKKVRNRLIKEKLLVNLHYPTYKEGVKAIIEQETLL